LILSLILFTCSGNMFSLITIVFVTNACVIVKTVASLLLVFQWQHFINGDEIWSYVLVGKIICF
jgi:hypothetical protein